MVLSVVSHSHAQTQQLGQQLGELLQGGELLLLEGQLGMGKTTFTQGLARGLGITDTINSPTFTLLKEYVGIPQSVSPASILSSHHDSTSQFELRRRRERRSERVNRRPSLYHFDLYRLEDPEEMFALGFDDYFTEPSGVCVVEWADRAEGLWPHERLDILLHLMGETERGLTFTASGTRYHELLQQFQKSAYAITGS